MVYEVHRLGAGEASTLKALSECFATAFDDRKTYCENPPSLDYLESLLSEESFVALIARNGVTDNNHTLVGGLVAYELKKFEQSRSELYIYDLAVSEEFRRQGIATRLIEALKPIAKKINAWTIYVQADVDDEIASRLYENLGTSENVLHFDINPHLPNQP